MTTRAYVALGSNLGDRVTNLRLAVQRLAAHPKVRVRRASRLFETPAIGPPQGPYLNAVLAIETDLAPEELLALCQGIEAAGRRQRSVHWGPRTIDLDLVDVGGLVLTTSALRLPHPELANRPFVLAPLADVAPEWCHPATGEPVAALLDRVRGDLDGLVVVADGRAWCAQVPGMETEP